MGVGGKYGGELHDTYLFYLHKSLKLVRLLQDGE